MLCLIRNLHIPHRNDNLLGEKGASLLLNVSRRTASLTLDAVLWFAPEKWWISSLHVGGENPNQTLFILKYSRSARWTGGLLHRQLLKLAYCAEEGAEPGGKAFPKESLIHQTRD